MYVYYIIWGWRYSCLLSGSCWVRFLILRLLPPRVWPGGVDVTKPANKFLEKFDDCLHMKNILNHTLHWNSCSTWKSMLGRWFRLLLGLSSPILRGELLVLGRDPNLFGHVVASLVIFSGIAGLSLSYNGSLLPSIGVSENWKGSTSFETNESSEA